MVKASAVSAATRAPGGPRRHHVHHLLDPVVVALHHGLDRAIAAIANPAGDADRAGGLGHRDAIADALHPAGNDEPPGDHRVSAGRRRTKSRSAATVFASVISPLSSASSIASTPESRRPPGIHRRRVERPRTVRPSATKNSITCSDNVADHRVNPAERSAGSPPRSPLLP